MNILEKAIAFISPQWACQRAFYAESLRSYEAGEIFRNPGLAKTLRTLAETECEDLYTGELMKRIVDHSRNL